MQKKVIIVLLREEEILLPKTQVEDIVLELVMMALGFIHLEGLRMEIAPILILAHQQQELKWDLLNAAPVRLQTQAPFSKTVKEVQLQVHGRDQV
jgi:hypothetical protein